MNTTPTYTPNQGINILTLDTEIEQRLLFVADRTTSICNTPPHIQRFYEMIFNFSPIPMRHIAADHIYHTDSPYILFRAPYILHTSNTCGIGPYRRFVVAFHHNVLSEFSGICKLGMLNDHLECIIPTTAEQMQALEPLLLNLCRSQDPAVPKHMWLGLLAALLYEVNELMNSSVPHKIEFPPYMQELLLYITEHLDEPLSLDSLAERFFVSIPKLTRDFRKTVNTSLHEYITAVRIHHAKILLKEGVPLSIISQKCGYTQESSFIYMFRSRTGMTPGEYRKSTAMK